MRLYLTLSLSLLLPLSACPGDAPSQVTETGIVTETTTLAGGESTTGDDWTTTYPLTETSTVTSSSGSESTSTTEGYCSDTLQQPDEECDGQGDNDGRYGGCNEDCTLAPRCGDGIVDEGHEVCDGGEGCPRDCGVSACAEIG